ncbi:MAG: transcription antitermination factor NusB [Planctomycetota bacterium]|nr:transcription antitermination factor NusB [Planctomycetota bacterium]
MSRVRMVAAEVLRSAERESIFVDEALERARNSDLSGRDRGFLTHLVYGVTRRRNTLDWLLKKISGVRKIDNRLLNPLRIALYEMHYLDGAAHAAVNEAVESCRKAGKKSTSFVNAVLRKASTADREALLPEEDAIRHSMPEWILERWKRFYPDQYTDLLESCNRILPVTARVNRLRAKREELSLPAGTHPDSVLLEGSVGDRPEIVEGKISVQDETAMAVAPLLQPEGKRIVDLCASPGGKATHAAELGGRFLRSTSAKRKFCAWRRTPGGSASIFRVSLPMVERLPVSLMRFFSMHPVRIPGFSCVARMPGGASPQKTFRPWQLFSESFSRTQRSSRLLSSIAPVRSSPRRTKSRSTPFFPATRDGTVTTAKSFSRASGQRVVSAPGFVNR